MKTIDINIVLDKSGSMGLLRQDIIGSFNTFIKEQKKEHKRKKVNFTLNTFNGDFETVYESIALKDVPELTEETYIPSGSTALLDSIGRTIAMIEQRYSTLAKKDKPVGTVIVIYTDGHENTSKEFNKAMLSKVITEKRELGWQFLFLASDEESIQDAIQMGMSMDTVITTNFHGAQGAQGYSAAHSSVGNIINTYVRSGASEAMSFSDADRKAQADLMNNTKGSN